MQSIRHRPEYRHSEFGLEVFSLDKQEPLFRLNADKLFTPGSTTKLLTEGSALQILGPQFRFHTRVYETGAVDSQGTLPGDLVLVASGDPNLSNRIQPDGTLAFENEDHSYGGSKDTKTVPGDPLAVIRQFAAQIAGKGIKHVTGRVLVDVSLFPEGERELGTGVVISPIAVNDNVLDVTVAPGTAEGSPARLTISPESSYVKVVNQIKTTKPGGLVKMDDPAEKANPDGTYTVTVTGSAPLGSAPILFSYPVAQPSRFAETVLVQALREKGIEARAPRPDEKIDFAAEARDYTPENVVAEHVSPPLSEEIKVTLKVSQNLHASMMPFILGAVAAKAKTDIEQAGFNQEHNLLQTAGLDLSGASQADGAGGAESAFFTPDFMVHFLAYMARQNNFGIFKKALPILGRDGSLFDIQVNSPAAGHVFAKTGTFGAVDKLNHRLMLTGKGLAGYTTTANGQHVSFALYVNRVSLPLDDLDAVKSTAGQALGEIAAAVNLLPIDKADLP